jgi:hypothetical protein
MPAPIGKLHKIDAQTDAYSGPGLGSVIQNGEHVFVGGMLFRTGDFAMPATNAFFSIYENSFHQNLLSLQQPTLRV